jgi:hypothetical protein
MPATRLSSVDLPEPDGPISAIVVALVDIEIDADEHRRSLIARERSIS